MPIWPRHHFLNWEATRGYDPRLVVESYLVNVWMGCYRMSHTEVLRYEDTLKALFGWKQTPSGSSYGRFFNKFSQARNQAVFPALQQRFLESIPLQKLTLDVDSSVIVRYGAQEGVARGYNPSKPGRGSHHPLLAFVAESRMVANAWMRPGNTGASSSAEHFLEETFSILGRDRIGLLRADSGFCSEKMMRYFDENEVPFILAARYPRLQSHEPLPSTRAPILQPTHFGYPQGQMLCIRSLDHQSRQKTHTQNRSRSKKTPLARRSLLKS